MYLDNVCSDNYEMGSDYCSIFRCMNAYVHQLYRNKITLNEKFVFYVQTMEENWIKYIKLNLY